MTTRVRHLNSIKELQAEKSRLRELAKMRKSRLDSRAEYFMQNSGSILFSTISTHFILKRLPIIGELIQQREKEPSGNMAYPAALRQSEGLSSMQKTSSILLSVWKVAQPFVLSAVLKRLSSFFGKKK